MAYQNPGILPQSPDIAQAGQNYGSLLANLLSGLGDAYNTGQQQSFQRGQEARTVQGQNLFKDGLPTGPDGKTDINALIGKLVKFGGAGAANGLVDQLWRMQYLAGDDAAGGGRPQPQDQPVTPRSTADYGPNAGPGSITGSFTGSQPTAPGDSKPDTFRSLAASIGESAGGDKDIPRPDMDNMARAIGLKSPDDDVPADKAARARQIVGAYFKRSGAGQGDDGTVSERPSAPSQGGGAVSPNPQAGGAANMVPKGVDPRAYAMRLKQAAEADRAKAHREGIVGFPSKALEDAAAAKDKQADAILEQLGKAGELTGEQKNARDKNVLGFDTTKKVMEADVDESKKKYDGLQNLGQVGQIGNQKLDRIRAVMSDPNFFSGAGNEIAKLYKQWSVSFGGDPNKAGSMEEFNKTAQQLLADDIKAMGASGAGPVRVAEVNIMKQATANLGISPATNRYLVEEAYRVHNDNIAVARLAQQYKQAHGYLDAGWDKVRDQYYEEHPLFSKEELANPRLVAPPMLPRAIAADPSKLKVWERQQGVKSGDPFKTEDGRIRWVR